MFAELCAKILRSPELELPTERGDGGVEGLEWEFTEATRSLTGESFSIS